MPVSAVTGTAQALADFTGADAGSGSGMRAVVDWPVSGGAIERTGRQRIDHWLITMVEGRGEPALSRMR